MSQSQYIVPGDEFHDELIDEGQHITPGSGFLDNADDNVTTAALPAAPPRAFPRSILNL